MSVFINYLYEPMLWKIKKIRCNHSTWSNIAIGIARVATALGESTIPDILRKAA